MELNTFLALSCYQLPGQLTRQLRAGSSLLNHLWFFSLQIAARRSKCVILWRRTKQRLVTKWAGAAKRKSHCCIPMHSQVQNIRILNKIPGSFITEWGVSLWELLGRDHLLHLHNFCQSQTGQAVLRPLAFRQPTSLSYYSSLVSSRVNARVDMMVKHLIQLSNNQELRKVT